MVLSALALLAVILSMMVSPSTGGGATSDAAFANAGFVAGRDGDADAGTLFAEGWKLIDTSLLKVGSC